MQSQATTVDHYMQEVPRERLPALFRIRTLCLDKLKGYEEIMRYGMPCYEKNKITEVAFASQKNNIALYMMKQEIMEKYKGELKGMSTGKACIRFTKPGKIDFDLVEKMLADIYASNARVC